MRGWAVGGEQGASRARALERFLPLPLAALGPLVVFAAGFLSAFLGAMEVE